MQRTVNPARPRLACLNSSPVATAALVPAALLASPAGRTRAGGSCTSPRTCKTRGSGRNRRTRSSMIWSKSTGARRRGHTTRRRSRGQRSRRCSQAARQHGLKFPRSSGFSTGGTLARRSSLGHLPACSGLASKPERKAVPLGCRREARVRQRSAGPQSRRFRRL